jgi:hypothetical protein
MEMGTEFAHDALLKLAVTSRPLKFSIQLAARRSELGMHAEGIWMLHVPLFASGSAVACQRSLYQTADSKLGSSSRPFPLETVQKQFHE